MIQPSVYRRVFGTPEGRDVFADLCRLVEAMPPAVSGSAGMLIAHIGKMREIADVAESTKKKPPEQGIGRIEHG